MVHLPPPDETDPNTLSTPKETAEFIQAHARELSYLAKTQGWPVLTHLLEMATLEAGTTASNEAGK